MLEKLKSLFFVQDKEVSKENNGVGKKKKITLASLPKKSDITDLTSKKSKKFQEMLLNAIEQNDFEGYDYLEFRKTLLSLQKVTPDKEQRYTSALTMVGAIGSSEDHLITTANEYLKILEKENASFNAALQRQKEKMVDNRKQEIKHTNQLIIDKQKQIAKLEHEVTEHYKSLSKLTEIIKESDNIISKNKSNFDAAYRHITNEIQVDINRIEQAK